MSLISRLSGSRVGKIEPASSNEGAAPKVPSSRESATISVSRIAQLMQEIGYRGKLVSGDNWSWVESAANGIKFHIYAYSETYDGPETPARSIQFDGGWGGITSYDARRFLKICNRFNHEWRYAKATIATDNDRFSLSVKLDHFCPEGISDDEFFAVADMFIRLIEDMAKRTSALSSEDSGALAERHRKAVSLMWGADANPAAAVAAFSKNAQAGYSNSMCRLAQLYEDGLEVKQSTNAAIYFFSRAAERGQPTAYYGLARMLAASGTEEEDVLIEAAKYAILAARDLPAGRTQNLAEALKELIFETLSEEACSTSIELASAWSPLVYEHAHAEEAMAIDGVPSTPSSTLN